MENNRIILPLTGALLAAVIGGVLWAVIVVLTDYEIGLVAWAIGGLAGYWVTLFAGRQANRGHQVIAVIGSLAGILLGKYFMFGYVINGGVIGMFDNEVITLFSEHFAEFFGGMDIVFVLLAVLTAWQLPARMSNRPAPTGQPFGA